MQIRLLINYVTRVTIYLHHLFIFTATVNFIDYADKNYFLQFGLCHFQETEENFEMRCYTVLWKLCMADLNNVQN